MLALSNNPLVRDAQKEPCLFVEGTPLEVLYKALDLVAGGRYSLFAHPIAGNERLLRNPFRTVVLQSGAAENGTTPEQQMASLNRALNKMEIIDYGAIPEGTLQDYQTVDYELYLGTIRGAQN